LNLTLKNCKIIEKRLIIYVRIGPNENISQPARTFQEEGRLTAKDAIHLACAVDVKADYFLTCDDRLLKQAKKLKSAPVLMNPVDYIRKEIG